MENVNILNQELSNQKEELSDYEFLRLFFACLYTKNKPYFYVSNLKYDLYPFKEMDEYKDLLQDIGVLHEEEGDCLDIEAALKKMAILRLINVQDNINSHKSMVLMDDIYSWMVTSEYDVVLCDRMYNLVNAFLSSKEMDEQVTSHR